MAHKINNRIGINIFGILYDMDKICDIYIDPENNLIVELVNNSKDEFRGTKEQKQKYLKLWKETFSKII